MLLIVKGALPLFVKVVDNAPLAVPTRCPPKASVPDVSVTVAAGEVPVPVSEISWGLPDASSVTRTAAVRVPVVVGVKVTEMVQLAPAASVLGASGQVFVCA